ncbi:hypothetical protein CEK27_002146 [Fusarium fujikuroi]|nr:hypothetical protein CEK27_002146 [Fusarium fujikuroi]
MSRILALVTGSTQGIGLAVAKELAIKHNYHVLLGVRNTKAGEEIASDLQKGGHQASVVELDLNSPESIEKAVKHIEEKYGYLDVLINNAAVLLDFYKDLSTWDLFSKTFTTNVVGTGCLTQSILPLIRKAKNAPPRIVFVSSVMGSLTKATDETTIYYNIDYKAYDASKAAVNMLMLNFARELRDVGGKLFAARTPETQSFLWRMVASEEERFREKLHTFSPHEVHLCLEAMIIYMMMSMSEPDSESKERTTRLFETAELIGSRFLDHTGSYSTTEIAEPSSTWEDWIFAESRRRMSCLWLIIGCVITIENGKKCSICSDMCSLPLPSSKLLWEARSFEEWQTEKAFFDMSCPMITLGELVEAKTNAGNPVGAQRLQSWEMGSDKMAAMLNIAVEFIPRSFTRPMPIMRGPAPPTYPPTPPSQGTKRKASDAAPTSENNELSQTLPPSPKRTQREASFLSISSDGHEYDPHQHDELAPRDDRTVINTEPELSDEQNVYSTPLFTLDAMSFLLAQLEARVREDKRLLPFGGIQVIVTGDFCQLAPVKPFQFCYVCGVPTKFNKSDGLHTCIKSREHGPWADEDKWAFRSNAWAETNFTCFNLTDIHRQNDPSFIKLLQKCRLGIPFTENDIDLLMNHDCEVENAPQLLCTREEVDPINHAKFQEITEYEPKRYTVLDGFKWNQKLKWEKDKYSASLEDGTLVVHKEHQLDPVVNLKQTMQVMLQVNLDIRDGLVNGSQGVVCGWEKIDLAKLPVLQGEYSNEREGLVRAFTTKYIQLHPDKRDHVWPRVRFSNGRVRTIYPWCVITPVGEFRPYSLLQRTQIPLIPGWAITIHKSQGMTLERVIVNLSRAFAEGQVYVALSRATCLRGLRVEGEARGITVGEGGNEEVRQFLADTFGTETFEGLEDEEHEESKRHKELRHGKAEAIIDSAAKTTADTSSEAAAEVTASEATAQAIAGAIADTIATGLTADFTADSTAGPTAATAKATSDLTAKFTRDATAMDTADSAADPTVATRDPTGVYPQDMHPHILQQILQKSLSQMPQQRTQPRTQPRSQQILQQPQPMPLLPSNPSTSGPADNENDFLEVDLASEVDLVPEPTLCKEQQDLLDLIMSGRNVFFTGSAGCGKSTVLKAAVKKLRAASKIVHITAPTGRAALGVNGVTTWSYMGWTIDSMKSPLSELKSDSHRKTVKARLTETHVLVIDEISMVENHHFQRMNECLKSARCWSQQHSDYWPNAPAFGGVQLLITGDFCQLPPVKPFGHCMRCGSPTIPDTKRNPTEWNCSGRFNCGPFYVEDQWAFRSDAWEEANFSHVHLKEIHRQSDQSFVKMLQKCRLGIPFSKEEGKMLLKQNPDDPKFQNVTKLFAYKNAVQEENRKSFDLLPGRSTIYEAIDGFDWRPHHTELEHYKQNARPDKYSDILFVKETKEQCKDSPLDAYVEMKINALVMLKINLDTEKGLVNGSQGIVVGWEPHDPAKLPNTKKNTLLNIDVLAGHHAHWRANLIREYAERRGIRQWPIVRFNNGITPTIYPWVLVNTLGATEPYSILYRTQLPLVLAWAVSIHKSRGMTLTHVTTDLSQAWEQPLKYVALSRVTSLDGLAILKPGGRKKRVSRKESLNVIESSSHEVREFLEDKFGRDLFTELEGNR